MNVLTIWNLSLVSNKTIILFREEGVQMEISKKSLEEFMKKMEENCIISDDCECVIENLSYLAKDNGFDKEGFFDELIYMLHEM